MWQIISISLLKQHERIIKIHGQKLLRQIKLAGKLKNPIVVDKNSLVILDGHHRFWAIKQLNLSSIPVVLVDYRQKKIRVFSRRKGVKVNKKMIIEAGISGRLLRPKTSRHVIPGRPLNINVNLKELV